MMRIFGPEWRGTTAVEELEEIVPPVGAACTWCREAIASGDSGVVQDGLDFDEVGCVKVTSPSLHHECFLRSIFGSVAHQRGHHQMGNPCGVVCSDDPALTTRQAARAAVGFYQRRMEVEALSRYGSGSTRGETTLMPQQRMTRQELLRRLEQAAELIESVLGPGNLDTREVTCNECPHGPHVVRSNLNEYKAKTELSSVLNKIQKWTALLKEPGKHDHEGSDDGHQ